MADGMDVYTKAENYWSSVASDVDGMLGGFEQLHQPDINTSKQFLMDLKKRVGILKLLILKSLFILGLFIDFWDSFRLRIGHWTNYKTFAITAI